MGTGEIVVALGLVTMMGILFKTNRDDIKKNTDSINDHRQFLHSLDKKVDILLTIWKIQDRTTFEKAKKINGN